MSTRIDNTCLAITTDERTILALEHKSLNVPTKLQRFGLGGIA